MRHLIPALLLVCTSVVVRATDTDWTQSSDLIGIARSMTALKVAAADAGVPATPTPGLSLEAKAYLKSIGLDPASEEVRLAAEDGTISTTFSGAQHTNSLESLAIKGSAKGVREFLTTRSFYRKLKVDFAGTPIPETGYDGRYLTTEERRLVMRKYLES